MDSFALCGRHLDEEAVVPDVRRSNFQEAALRLALHNMEGGVISWSAGTNSSLWHPRHDQWSLAASKKSIAPSPAPFLYVFAQRHLCCAVIYILRIYISEPDERHNGSWKRPCAKFVQSLYPMKHAHAMFKMSVSFCQPFSQPFTQSALQNGTSALLCRLPLGTIAVNCFVFVDPRFQALGRRWSLCSVTTKETASYMHMCLLLPFSRAKPHLREIYPQMAFIPFPPYNF